MYSGISARLVILPLRIAGIGACFAPSEFDENQHLIGGLTHNQRVNRFPVLEAVDCHLPASKAA